MKNVLRDMEQRGAIDMELEDTEFYASTVMLKVARVGMQQTVRAWNYHTIPGNIQITSIGGFFLYWFLLVHGPDIEPPPSP